MGKPNLQLANTSACHSPRPAPFRPITHHLFQDDLSSKFPLTYSDTILNEMHRRALCATIDTSSMVQLVLYARSPPLLPVSQAYKLPKGLPHESYYYVIFVT